jgi:hypothetical protein
MTCTTHATSKHVIEVRVPCRTVEWCIGWIHDAYVLGRTCRRPYIMPRGINLVTLIDLPQTLTYTVFIAHTPIANVSIIYGDLDVNTPDD